MEGPKMAIYSAIVIIVVASCAISTVEARYMPNEAPSSDATISSSENESDQKFQYDLQLPGLARFAKRDPGKRHFPGMMRFGKRAERIVDTGAADKRLMAMRDGDDVRLKYAMPIFRVWY